MAQQTEEQTSDEQTANNHGPVAVDCGNCGNCGTEMDVDAEAIRLGGVIECPICEADVDLDEAGDGIDRGRGIETDGGEPIPEDSLDRDEGGIVKTQAGKWHVFRHGRVFSCAQGAADLFEDGGPYTDAEIFEDDTMSMVRSNIVEAMESKRDAGESLCLKCASTYGVEYPAPSDPELVTDGGQSTDEDDWDPEPAELRDGQAPDDSTHASVNAYLARRARRILGREDDAVDRGEGVRSDGGVTVAEADDAGSIHEFNAIEEGEDIRLAVHLPAHGDVIHLDGEHVEDFLFATVLDVERFDAGGIREMTIENRERGRLRVKWNGGIYPDDEPRTEPKKVAYHRGDVLRIGQSD